MNISHYDTEQLAEAQFEPGSRGRVLKNILGIRSKRAMDEMEATKLADATVRQADMNARIQISPQYATLAFDTATGTCHDRQAHSPKAEPYPQPFSRLRERGAAAKVNSFAYALGYAYTLRVFLFLRSLKCLSF